MSEDDIRAERHEEGREPVPGDTDAQADTASGVTRRTLLVVGILVVVLAFLAGFIGARMGSPAAPDPLPTESVSPEPSPSPEPSVSPEPTETDEPEKEEPVVLPAGADVRAGLGVPDSAHGEEGDVFIDLESADVYVRGADGWRRAGNIRTSALENLTGSRAIPGSRARPGNRDRLGSRARRVNRASPVPPESPASPAATARRWCWAPSRRRARAPTATCSSTPPRCGSTAAPTARGPRRPARTHETCQSEMKAVTLATSRENAILSARSG